MLKGSAICGQIARNLEKALKGHFWTKKEEIP